MLALLAVFANPLVIIAAALTAAAHHALLWAFLPASVFNYDAPIWVVGVHALFVVLESVAACFIARSFFDNVVELEQKVAARTEEVNARNRDMRMLLNAVEQGFFTIGQDGVMSEERSAAVDSLLGEPELGMTLPDFLRQHDSHVGDWVELGLEDAFAGIMPVEVILHQMPSRIEANGRTLKIEYTPVESEGEVTALAVVCSDISAQVEREKMEVEHREMMAMIERIAADKSGFLEFFQEAEDLIAALRDDSRADLQLVKRQVHTLKGNSAIFGIERISAACHTIEDHIAENGELPEGSCWTELFGCWASVRGNLKRLIGNSEEGLSIDEQAYADILTAVLEDAPKDELARQITSWKLEPTQKRMERISEQARALATRLGKGNINVHRRGGELRIDPKQWSSFWSSFVHVVRNAVDHGLESAEDRRIVGKSEAGTLEISTELENDQFVISIKDDGRGIDWEKLGEKARSQNLPADSHEHLVDALFVDGLSTAVAVTDTSGRGVGMGAVRAACDELGGSIEIHSQQSVGTTMQFKFPIAAMAPATVELLGSYGIARPEHALTNATAY